MSAPEPIDKTDTGYTQKHSALSPEPVLRIRFFFKEIWNWANIMDYGAAILKMISIPD